MADTTALKNRIRAAIKANDNQEITGPILQQTLLDIVDELNNDRIIDEYGFLPSIEQIGVIMPIETSTKGTYCKLPNAIPNGAYMRVVIEEFSVTPSTATCQVYCKTNLSDATYIMIGYAKEGGVCQTQVDREVNYIKIEGASITSIHYKLKVYYSNEPFDTVEQINDQRMSWYSLREIALSSLVADRYYKLDDSVTRNPQQVAYTNCKCLKVAVKHGDIVRLGTVGGENARAWALSDRNDIIKSRATITTITENFPQTLLCTEDGFLYVNAMPAVTDFSLQIYSPVLYTQMLDYQLTAKIGNPKIDLRRQTLHILDIGNSYSIDATHYLPNIVNALFDNASLPDISVYRAERSSGSFKLWTDIYNNADTGSYKIRRILGAELTDVTEATEGTTDYTLFRTLLAHEWDVIVIHQVSDYSADYELWNGNGNGGYLKEFMRILRNTNPQACVGYLFTHSYRSSYNISSNKEKDSYARWQHMADAVKKMSIDYGIDLIIPAGTAVQNMRLTALNDSNEFSSDGTHLADGIGDYVASCAYYQTIFAPRYGVSIMGNTFRDTTLDEMQPGVKNINDANALLAQKAAVLACADMYHVIDPTNITIATVSQTPINPQVLAYRSQVPANITRYAVDAILVNSDNDPLIYLRQASSSLAGLMTAAEHNKLDELPTASELYNRLSEFVTVTALNEAFADSVHISAQALSDREKQVARHNIGAASLVEIQVIMSQLVNLRNKGYFTKDLGYMGTTMGAGETECAKAEYSGDSKTAWLLFTYGSTGAINTAMVHQEHGETTTKQTIFAGSNVSSRTITFTDSNKTVVASVSSWSRETSLFGVQTTDTSIVLRMLNPLLKSSRGLYQLTLPAATTSRAGMMSATDKTKFDGIEPFAQQNVQPDWNQTDGSADDYIKNKPTNLVGSTSVRTIVVLTQAQYDALTTKDTNTEYNIIESV